MLSMQIDVSDKSINAVVIESSSIHMPKNPQEHPAGNGLCEVEIRHVAFVPALRRWRLRRHENNLTVKRGTHNPQLSAEAWLAARGCVRVSPNQRTMTASGR